VLGAGEIMTAVQVAMIGGLPYTAPARRDPGSPDAWGGAESIVFVQALAVGPQPTRTEESKKGDTQRPEP